MTAKGSVAVRGLREYPRRVRALLHLIVLLSVALLPLTSFAARADTPADLTSSAIELESARLPAAPHRSPPAQEHRHCTLWAAEAAACMALSDNLSLQLPASFASETPYARLLGPKAPTPPPKG